MRSVNSAFFTLMQGDSVNMAELIDLEAGLANFRFTTSDREIFYTLSGTLTKYVPFPGAGKGTDEAADLSVAQAEFTVANTGDLLPTLVSANALAMARVKIGRVHVSTPDCGRMEIFQGTIGDLAHDRMSVQGQVRNLWNSLSTRFPYYTYQDRCGWRFGSTGCGFNTTSITLTGSINVGSSTTLNLLLSGNLLSNSYSAGRFQFGRLTITGGVNSGAVRTIRTHTGDLIGLSHALDINSLAGLTFSIYPGCNKRYINDCTSLYNNAQNFLGFPWIPIQEQAW